MERKKQINQLFNVEFNIFDCFISHRILILRHSYISDEKNWNLDIKFEGVTYLELPTNLSGIHLYNGSDLDRDYILSRYDGEENENTPNNLMELFVILNRKKRYYIMASCVSIETNDLPNDVSSIVKTGNG